MSRVLVLSFAIIISTALAPNGPVAAREQDRDQAIAPELSGLGQLHVEVTSAVPRAQRFFNQGVRLLYAYNHQEALRAFREAARLDPALAMAYWGQAMTLGPNLNAPMPAANVAPAYAAIQRAKTLAASASLRERALVDAVAERYVSDPPADRAPLDRAYAAAMRRVAAAYPGDPDVQTFFADALMNTMPWDYWQKDGTAKPDTATAIAAVEQMIARHPDHPGANHYLIHLMEASNNPDRAVASADRLGLLMPGAGHMVHMPAHIYIRVGRYADAAEANVRAIRADEDYLAQCQAQGLYPVSYYPHNLHFLWAAATFEGRSAVAIEAARKVAEKTPHHHAGALAWTADFPVTPLLAYTRFGKWREILTEPSPPANQPYAIGIWHYARAMAFVAGDRLDRADAELAALKTVMGHEAFSTSLKDLPLLTNLRIASKLAEGERRARARQLDDAIALVKEAVEIEDGIPYNEPPVWHHPPRQVLGALLLQRGRAAEAEKTYREDLERFRENGWSLFGLAQSLTAQGHADEAAAVRARFQKAWARADVTLSSSRLLPDDSPAVRTARLATGVEVEYVERGDPDGLPVVFLPGLSDSWRSFEPVLPLLPDSIRALAISQRGHGNSSKPRKGYRVTDFAADVRAFLDARQIPAAVIVGHSFGATIAQQFAIDYPGRTLGVVLMGSFAQPRRNTAVNELWDSVSKMTDVVTPRFAREFQESTIARPVAPAYVDLVTAETLKMPAHVLRASLREFMKTDLSRKWGRITVPTLIAWGDRDSFVPRADGELLNASIPGSRFVIHRGAGHAFHWEDPTRFASDLAAFVSAIIDASAAHLRAREDRPGEVPRVR